MSLVHAFKQDRFYSIYKRAIDSDIHIGPIRTNFHIFLISTDFQWKKSTPFVINFYVLRIYSLPFGCIFMVKSVGHIPKSRSHQPIKIHQHLQARHDLERPGICIDAEVGWLGMMVRMLAPAKWNRNKQIALRWFGKQHSNGYIYFFPGEENVL